MTHKISDILTDCHRLSLKTGDCVFRQGQACHHYIIVDTGIVKVFARSDNGKEITLYRINAGEVCVLTTSCLFANTNYPAEAIVEQDVEAFVLSKAQFDQRLAQSSEFRDFAFRSFGSRLSDLMQRIEAIALESVSFRLKSFLTAQATSERRVEATHQEIAVEIGSAREVVSRHLKSLEQQRFIKLHRGFIEIC